MNDTDEFEAFQDRERERQCNLLAHVGEALAANGSSYETVLFGLFDLEQDSTVFSRQQSLITQSDTEQQSVESSCHERLGRICETVR